MLQIKHLSLGYEGFGVIEELNLKLSAGQLCLLKGANGCGKTSLLNAISGIIPEHVAASLSGDIFFDNKNFADIPLKEKFCYLWFAQSDTETQFFFPTCEAELAFALENQGLAPDEIKRRIEASAHFFGLRNCMQQSPLTLSGGQKRLLLCAIGKALNPPLFLLDEPLSGLSEQSVKLVISWLEELKAEGKIVMISEHHQQLDTIADVVVKLENKAAKPLREKTFNNPVPYQDIVHNIAINTVEPLFKVDKLSFAFPGADKLIENFSLNIKRGDCLLIKGANGCGKSTLLKLLMGFLTPRGGSIKLAGKPVSGFDSGFFKHVYYQSQVTQENLLGISAEHNWQLWQLTKPDLPDFSQNSDLLYSELSAGELQSAAQQILPFIMDKFWLLDEPFNHLDASARYLLLDLLNQKRKTGVGYIVVAHEIDDINNLFNMVLNLSSGGVNDAF